MESTLPDDLLQPLFKASKYSNLRRALEILIDTSKTEGGRADLASKDVLPSVLKLCQSIPHSLFHTRSSGHEFLTLSLKLLRNLCAGEITNQSLFVALNGPEIVSAALCSPGLVSEPDHGIVRFGLQALGNVSLAGQEYQQAIWRWFFPDEFVALAKIRSRGTCDPLCMIICTCCDGNSSLVEELCGDQGSPILAEVVRTASIVGFGEDWFKLLLSRACLEEVRFQQLFSFLYSASDFESRDSGVNLFSTEQAYLLGIIAEILNERLEEITVSVEFASYIFGIFKRSFTFVDGTTRGKSGLPTGSAAIDVLGYSLTILRDICAQHRKAGVDDDFAVVIDTILSYGLLELLLHVLSDLEPPPIIQKAMKQNENQEAAPSKSYKLCPYKGFRRDIVAVIGNCAFQRKTVQDEIRQKNGVLLLLQQCVTDDDNPYLREWGIWCVRNLLEGNVDNQKAVAELELQRTGNLPELSGLGLRVEVDPNTRRARLVNV